MSKFNFRKYYSNLDTGYAFFLENHKSKLGVPDQVKFIPSNHEVYTAFAYDISRSSAGSMVNILKKNVRVLIYNGQDDFVVNTPGVLNYLNNLNWDNMIYWKRARKQIWTTYGAVKGWAKVYNNLWFVLVNHAGHMVPTDQPEAAFRMIGQFIYD